ncbi:MAG: DUF5667 domain-containing protein [Patescibacteria group bacterium]
MNWLLEKKLRDLGAHADPSPRFVRVLQKKLKHELNHPIWWISSWKWAVSATTVLTLVGSGTVAYAYASDAVLPDHPLYGVRTTLENIEASLTANADQKVHVELKIIKRRLHEVEALSSRKKADQKRTKRLIELTLDRAHSRTLSLPEPAFKETQDAMPSSSPEEEIVRQVDFVIERTEEGH